MIFSPMSGAVEFDATDLLSTSKNMQHPPICCEAKTRDKAEDPLRWRMFQINLSYTHSGQVA
jgi:hypothetical protein